MKVTANVLLNYIRCRRYAALNDSEADYISQEYEIHSHNYYNDYINMFENIYFTHTEKVEKNITLSYDFHSDIQLSDSFHYQAGNKLYYLLPTTSKDFLKLVYRQGKHRYKLFNRKLSGVYEIKSLNINDDTGNYEDKIQKLMTRTDDLGRIVFNYAYKQFLYNKVNPGLPKKVYIVLLNSEYIHDGYNYKKALYHVFDFSFLYEEYKDIIDADIYRMINHIELNDFTTCALVKNECNRNDTFECKFVDFCFSHLPKKNSIFDYFNANRGFDELTDEGMVHHDTYDLINEGHVDVMDVPISWLKDEKHLMQRYCVESNFMYVNDKKIEAILKTLKYPLIYLDFEALPCLMPRYKGEKPYTQSVFQYSIHVELEENKLDKDGSKHYEFIAKPELDQRKELVENLIRIVNTYDSSVIVYHKTFEQMRLKEMQECFPEYRKELQKIIDRLFDLKDVLKSNRKFYLENGFSDYESRRYNFYHKKLQGSYSLKKVVKVFNKTAYQDLEITNGVSAYKAFMSLKKIAPAEGDKTVQDLLEYCKQDTYSMFEIIQGLKKYLSKDFRIT
jgi:hypothetical protein